MAAYYAVTRTLDAGTGDVSMDGAGWLPGAPMTEVVKRVLRTPRGRYLPDPTFGVDWKKVDKAGAGAAATAKKVIEAALKPYVDRGQLSSLSVSTERSGRALLYEVAFVDPRTKVRDTVTGQL